jgi:Amt family ammonium transporter
VIANTNIAACAGALTTLIVTQLIYKRIDLTMILNGALAGLVSITAGPDYPSMELAMLIGMVGGFLVLGAVPLFDRLRIDDPVGALSVHLVAGVWGTLAVGIFKEDVSFGTQLIGVVTIGGFVFVSCFIVWAALKASVGIRLSPEQEIEGVDSAEFSTPAYSLSKTSAIWKGEQTSRGKLVTG